ncbi:MAG: HAMP domain-containing histidine kinase [Clostridiales bacterium]|nr:HAMP domain-containing histidine kinase [Clostridiales bacterium]
MNRITHSLVAKITALILAILFIMGFIGGAFGIYYMMHYDFYGTTLENVKDEVFLHITLRYANKAFNEYFSVYQGGDPFNLERYKDFFSEDNTNFLFTINDKNGELVLGNYNNQEYQFSYAFEYEDGEYVSEETDDSISYRIKGIYTVQCYVNKTLLAKDNYFVADQWINFLYPMRHTIIMITIISLIISILLIVFLMFAAGRKKGKEELTVNVIDKIPFDIMLGVLFTIGLLEYIIVEQVYYNNRFDSVIPAIFAVTFSVFNIPLVLVTLMSFATRYKLGGWWKNTILYRLFRFIYRILKKIVQGAKYLLQHISLLWRAILGLLILSIVEFFIIISTAYSTETLLFFWLAGKLIITPAILYIIINLQKLQIGSQKIAYGDLDYIIDTKHLFWDFKRHGENLNNISGGMSKAIDQRMKSERFKTELITNVSHDIKTPLTSIINYIDLIKREEIEDEKVKGFINVLDRQSYRLKKLIEDLVDASKASTGNMIVNSTRTEVGVLLTQAVGEYAERMADNDLELILNQPEESIAIMADGRLLWRVFDNLMGNICKYSQPGTRAYLNLEKSNGQVIITFRNISKYALNISSDELLERFIRGDSARTTEGSGLGLSIAKSLVELQKGQFDLVIDGDLFKVILTFDKTLQ